MIIEIKMQISQVFLCGLIIPAPKRALSKQKRTCYASYERSLGVSSEDSFAFLTSS